MPNHNRIVSVGNEGATFMWYALMPKFAQESLGKAMGDAWRKPRRSVIKFGDRVNVVCKSDEHVSALQYEFHHAAFLTRSARSSDSTTRSNRIARTKKFNNVAWLR